MVTKSRVLRRGSSLPGSVTERRICAALVGHGMGGSGVTEVGWSARKRAAQSTLKRAAVQPEVNLHREPGVLDRAVPIASTSELDVAADRAQRGAAAELRRAVSFHVQ